MEKFESKSYKQDNMDVIHKVHSAFSEYEEKRGNAEEALDILNADLIETPLNIKLTDSIGQLIYLSLGEVFEVKDELYAKLKVCFQGKIKQEIVEIWNKYNEFLDIDYVQKLDINNMEKFTTMINKVINNFVIAEKNGYTLDLGKETIVVSLERDNLILDSDEKTRYISGRLLKAEEKSDYIKRISKENALYTIYAVDGTEVILEIEDEKLCLQCAFMDISKLEKYISELETYVLTPYMDIFVPKSKSQDVKEESSSRLATFFGLSKKEKIIENTKEELVENLWIGKRNVEVQENQVEEVEEKKEETKHEWFQRFVVENLQKLESLPDIDQKMLDMTKKFCAYADKKIKTIELFKGKLNKVHEIDELINTAREFFSMSLIVFYTVYESYYPRDKENLKYLKDRILSEYDVNSIGFVQYIDTGNNGRQVLNNRGDRNSIDMCFYDENNIMRIYGVNDRKWEKNIGETSFNGDTVQKRPLRRSVPNSDWIILAKGTGNGNYSYSVHNMKKNRVAYNFQFEGKEKPSFTTRAKVGLKGKFFMVLGDEKLRFINVNAKKYNLVSMDYENYTVDEKGRFIGYDKDSFKLVDFENHKETQVSCSTDKLLGWNADVLSMDIRDETVRIMFVKTGKLMVRYYHISYFKKKYMERVKTYKDIPYMKEFVVEGQESSNHFDEQLDNEIFWSPDGQYAVWEKKGTVHILKFYEHGVSLMKVDSYIDINHIFRVRFSPDMKSIYLMDDSLVHKIELSLVERLQLDKDIEEKMKLDGERFDFLMTLKRMESKQKRESSEEYASEVMEKKRNMKSVLKLLSNKEKAIKQKKIDKAEASTLKPEILNRVLNDEDFDLSEVTLDDLQKTADDIEETVEELEEEMTQAAKKKTLDAADKLIANFNGRQMKGS